MTIKTVSSSQISGIDSLESGDDVWVRPSDWLQLPLVGDTEQKFVGLLAVNNVESNKVALKASGNFTVDWGDTAFTNCPTLSRVSTQDINQSITFSSSCLGPAALNEIYTNLATVTGKIITVTSNWGTASDNPAIATAKGWTVTG